MEYEGLDLKDEFIKAWLRVVEDDRRLGILKRRYHEQAADQKRSASHDRR